MFLFCLVFVMPLYVSVYMCFVVTCWERADLLALVCGVLLKVCYFPIGILGQVWYLIESIPDLCTLTYYGSDLCLSKNFVMHSCAKTGLNTIQEYPLVLEWGRY